MGWKSTIEITREEAKRLVIKKLTYLNDISNEDLATMIERLGYGEDLDLEYCGHNFIVIDN